MMRIARTKAATVLGAIGLLVILSDRAGAQQCRYYEAAQSCGALGCIPDLPEGAPEDYEPEQGDPGQCGACKADAHCDGRVCHDGVCGDSQTVENPASIWPHASLITASITTNLADETDPKPIVAPGFYFQGALSSAQGQLEPSGAYAYPNLPAWYFHAGAELALAGEYQHALFDVGLTLYTPSVFVTTWSIGPLFETSGSAIWQVSDSEQNQWRVGPALRLGFLYSVYVRAGYVFHVSGQAHDSGAVLLTLEYMRDLTADLVPDRYRSMVPDAVPR